MTRGILPDHLPLSGDEQDREGQQFNRGGEKGAFAIDGIFGLFTFGNILRHHHGAGNPPLGVAQGHRGVEDGPDGVVKALDVHHVSEGGLAPRHRACRHPLFRLHGLAGLGPPGDILGIIRNVAREWNIAAPNPVHRFVRLYDAPIRIENQDPYRAGSRSRNFNAGTIPCILPLDFILYAVYVSHAMSLALISTQVIGRGFRTLPDSAVGSK